ncbi:ABC-2 family transporter protein [Candidatus Daviesbacteria bacterium]|nr:ABC-2 family transporter protein [Candidatus Daviesbacteria bacterium]
MKEFKKFWAFLKLSLLDRLEYRGDMIIYSFGSSFIPLMGLALWSATSNLSKLPYNQLDLIAYFIAAIYIGIITEMWQSWFISEDVLNSRLSTYLLKPYPVIFRYMIENLGDKVFKITTVNLAMVVIFFIVPSSVWTRFHFDPLTISMFLLSVVLGYIIVFLFEVLIGLSTVWFYDIGFLKSYMDLAYTLFAGRLIPLAFFPSFLSTLALFTPFRYTLSFPIEILLNKLTVSQLIQGFSIEIAWVIISLLLYQLVYRGFEKSYKGYGS